MPNIVRRTFTTIKADPGEAAINTQCTFCGGGPRDFHGDVLGKCPSCGDEPISLSDFDLHMRIEGASEYVGDGVWVIEPDEWLRIQAKTSTKEGR